MESTEPKQVYGVKLDFVSERTIKGVSSSSLLPLPLPPFPGSSQGRRVGPKLEILRVLGTSLPYLIALFPPPLRASAIKWLRGSGILKRSRTVRYGLGEVWSDLEEIQKCLREGSGMICGEIGMTQGKFRVS